MGVGIHMPLLVLVATGLVAFAFHELKYEAISIPFDVENVSTNNIFRSRHKIPLEAQRGTCKNELYPFLPQEELLCGRADGGGSGGRR